MIDENKVQSTFDNDFEDDVPELAINARNILKKLITEENFIVDGDVNPDHKSDVVRQFENEFKSETDRLVNAERRKNRNEELHVTLSSIRQDLKGVRLLLPDRIIEAGFKPDELEYALKNVKEELDALQNEFANLS